MRFEAVVLVELPSRYLQKFVLTGKFPLALNGSFVTAELNMNGELIANRGKMDAWEIFEMFRLPDGKVAFRAFNGKFVGAKLHQHCQLVGDLPHVQVTSFAWTLRW